MTMKLGTARWADDGAVAQNFAYRPGSVWLGRLQDHSAIGHVDDRHVCLVSGSRAGKGTSAIIPNLCLWPGSVVVVDPKGENATVTAPRRGQGGPYCEGMGQAVHVLDPFQAATVEEGYRSRFNPLDALDPRREESIDEAARLADAIVVVSPGAKDPFWDESARQMVKGLILHILTSDLYEGARNLTTLRKLVLRGDTEGLDVLRQMGHEDAALPSAHSLLWQSVRRNEALGGVIGDIGHSFANMLASSPKQYESVIQVVNRNTEFLDSPAMQRMLAVSDFQLADLKRDPKGMSLYLCLPQRYMNTHFRWLRMMIALTITEMELVKGRPAAGVPVLMMLDEFAGLRRMEIIESAVAQIAGFGVKLFFVLQSLEQLKATYKDNWETFLANSGLKMFFGIEDHFSREYISKLIGETEVVREVTSRSEQHGTSQSTTTGTSHSVAESTGTSRSKSMSHTTNQTQGGLFGGWIDSSRSDSSSVTIGTSEGRTVTQGTNTGTSQGTTFSETAGASETLHKRALISPDEVGQVLARVDQRDDPRYPGLCVALISGYPPLLLRRINYFEDPRFLLHFSAHPDHPSRSLVLLEILTDSVEEIRKFAPVTLTVHATTGMEAFPRATLADVGAGQGVSEPVFCPIKGRVWQTDYKSPDMRYPVLASIVCYEADSSNWACAPFEHLIKWAEQSHLVLNQRTRRALKGAIGFGSAALVSAALVPEQGPWPLLVLIPAAFALLRSFQQVRLWRRLQRQLAAIDFARVSAVAKGAFPPLQKSQSRATLLSPPDAPTGSIEDSAATTASSPFSGGALPLVATQQTVSPPVVADEIATTSADAVTAEPSLSGPDVDAVRSVSLPPNRDITDKRQQSDSSAALPAAAAMAVSEVQVSEPAGPDRNALRVAQIDETAGTAVGSIADGDTGPVDSLPRAGSGGSGVDSVPASDVDSSGSSEVIKLPARRSPRLAWALTALAVVSFAMGFGWKVINRSRVEQATETATLQGNASTLAVSENPAQGQGAPTPPPEPTPAQPEVAAVDVRERLYDAWVNYGRAEQRCDCA